MLSSRSSTVLLPQLPAEDYSLALPGKSLSDSPLATLYFSMTRPNSQSSPWVERSGVLQALAELGVTGATGPGRLGLEATHVFRLMGEVDSNAADQRVFSARAGEPAQDINTVSYGVWRAGATSHTEIARTNTDGALGPGIGSEWMFRNDADFANFARVHMLADGAVLLDTLVRPPAAQSFPIREALVRHVPGVGNTPCAVTRNSTLAWSPGLVLGDFFDFLDIAASSPRGEIYASAGQATSMPTTTRRGIWEFCAGAPQLKALSANTTALGPNIPGTPTAVFQSFSPIIAPSTAGAFYFAAEGAPTFKGIFHHQAGVNRPVLLQDDEGPLGPGVSGFRFGSPSVLRPMAAGEFGLLHTSIKDAQGGNVRFGLWRLRPDRSPEAILVIGDTGSYAPAPGRVWQSISVSGVLSNGVVLALATTATPPSSLGSLSLWRIRPGRAPEELLKAGDLVRYPTTSGVQMRAVRGLSNTFVSSGQAALQDYAGDDSWLSASGHALLEVQVDGMEGLIFPTRYVRALVSDTRVLFQDGL